MFSYNNNSKDRKLFVTVPEEIKYNFNFLNSITELMKKVEESQCEKIYFSCRTKNINFNKLGTAYLYNVLLFFSQKRTVFASREVAKCLKEQVLRTGGEKFEKIDIKNRLTAEVQQCYCFDDDKKVEQTVQILVEFIAENNLIFENAKEFLVTTIGEIFSNAFNHSSQKRVYFMYDIEIHDKESCLVINITDFGNTIISNVQDFHRAVYGKSMSDKASIKWAMQDGNTTRRGSGGYGLPTLVDYIRKVDGELLIFSGNCMYALKGTTENILDSKGIFSGTSVSMKIPLFDTSRAILYDETSNKIISIDLDKI